MTTQTCSKSCLGIILFLSLTANVFFGGVLSGKHFFGGDDGIGGGVQIGKVIKAFRGLSDESREKAMAAAEKSWPDVQKSLKAVREKRDAVKKILAQPEYKQEDLDKAFAEVRAEVNKLMEAGQVLGSDILRELTPEERLKLIKKLPRPPAE
jgi:hypothetical protein